MKFQYDSNFCRAKDFPIIAAALSFEPITVDPIGEIVSSPPVPVPAPRKVAVRALAVVVDDLDDIIDGLASDSLGEESSAIDEALADMDWLHGDLDR